MSNKHPLTEERKDEIFEALQRNVPLFKARLLRWTEDAATYTNGVVTGSPSYEQQCLFIVRLAGILSDLRHRFHNPATIGRPSFTDELRETLRQSIENLYAQLSEDELLWLELRRHEQCHPVLDGYRPDVSAADDWNHRDSKILDGKEFSLDETIQRCIKLEHANGEFVGTAVAIARKTWTQVMNVKLAMLSLMAAI